DSAAWLQENLRVLRSRTPSVQNIRRDVGEKQRAILPDRSLTPDETLADRVNARSGINERIQGRIEALDQTPGDIIILRLVESGIRHKNQPENIAGN
ncbi:MAG: hypothetical protein WCA06_00750, partial [Terrimicrobiaceae bacterium]